MLIGALIVAVLGWAVVLIMGQPDTHHLQDIEALAKDLNDGFRRP